MNITLRPDLQERIKERIFLDHEEGVMQEEEFRDTEAAIDQALNQAERGEGISLKEFDHRMRAKYGVLRR